MGLYEDIHTRLSSENLTKIRVNITAFRDMKPCSFVGRHGTIQHHSSEDHYLNVYLFICPFIYLDEQV